MNPRQLGLACLTLCAASCAGFPDEAPTTHAVVENRYAAPGGPVVHRAYWQAVSFDDPVLPGTSSVVLEAVPSSPNRAYVLLAGPGPSTFVVLQSRVDFGATLGHTTRIPVDDATFTGNCAAGAPLAPAEADFITRLVFPDDFAGRTYDAATCTTTPIGDAGAH